MTTRNEPDPNYWVNLGIPPVPPEAEKGMAMLMALSFPKLWALLWHLDPKGDEPRYWIQRELARSGHLTESEPPEDPTAQCYSTSFHLTPKGRKAAHAIRGVVAPESREG